MDGRQKQLNKFKAMLYKHNYSGLNRKEAEELLGLATRLYNQAKKAEEYHNELQKLRSKVK